MEITKEEAQKAWNEVGETLGFVFDNFDAYWEDCQKFNKLSLEEQKEQQQKAKDKLKINL